MECCIQQHCFGYNGQTRPCAKCARGVTLVLQNRRVAKFCLVYHASLFSSFRSNDIVHVYIHKLQLPLALRVGISWLMLLAGTVCRDVGTEFY